MRIIKFTTTAIKSVEHQVTVTEEDFRKFKEKSLFHKQDFLDEILWHGGGAGDDAIITSAECDGEVLIENQRAGHTVVLLYPDYATDSYGTDVFILYSSEEDPRAAVREVRQKACETSTVVLDLDDLAAVAVFAGNPACVVDASSF